MRARSSAAAGRRGAEEAARLGAEEDLKDALAACNVQLVAHLHPLRLREAPLDELLPVQADVLQRAARLCRPGGTLVYATCSLLGAENDDQVAAFLASDDGADFELRPPESFHVPLDGDVLRLTPARHGCDGFFAAVLQRKEGGWSRRSRS